MTPRQWACLIFLLHMSTITMGQTVIISGLGADSSIAIAQLDKQTGQLTITDRNLKAGPSPSFLAWQGSSGGDAAVTNLLVANEAGVQGEAVTAVQLSSGNAIQTASMKTDEPCHIAVHPSGRWAVTASYSSGTVSVIELLQSASAQLQLGKQTTYPTEVVGQAAHEAKFSPDGSLLYVPCLKSDYIRMYKFNPTTGSLTPNNFATAAGRRRLTAIASNASDNTSSINNINPVMLSPAEAAQSSNNSTKNSTTLAATAAADAPASSNRSDDINPVMLSPAEALKSSSSDLAASVLAAGANNMAKVPAGSGPRHIVFHPTLAVAYVLNELSSTIARFDWHMQTGGHLIADFQKEPNRIVSMLPATVTAEPAGLCKRQAGAELAITNDGKFLYASNRGLCEGSEKPGVSNIVIFAVDGSSGALTALAWEDGGGDVNFPRHFSLSPDNAFLLVGNQKGESITVFRRDAATGMLGKVGTVSTVDAGVWQPSFVAVI